MNSDTFNFKIKDKNGITLLTKGNDEKIRHLLSNKNIKVFVDDKNLNPNNIKNGVEILGVTGSYIPEDGPGLLKFGYVGYPLYNDRYFYSIYVNKNMRPEVISDILNDLPFKDLGSQGKVYYVLNTAEGGSPKLRLKIEDITKSVGFIDTKPVYVIKEEVSNIIWWHNSTSNNTQPGYLNLFQFPAGWNPDITFPYSISGSFYPNLDGYGIVGSDNDLISEVLSSEPISKQELLLDGNFEGVEVTSHVPGSFSTIDIVKGEKLIPSKIKFKLNSEALNLYITESKFNSYPPIDKSNLWIYNLVKPKDFSIVKSLPYGYLKQRLIKYNQPKGCMAISSINSKEVSNKRIYLIGGYDYDQSQGYGSKKTSDRIIEYNAFSKVFVDLIQENIKLEKPVENQFFATLDIDGHKHTLLFGGTSKLKTSSPNDFKAIYDFEVYEESGKIIKKLTKLKTVWQNPRFGGITLVEGHKIYLIGGEPSDNKNLIPDEIQKTFVFDFDKKSLTEDSSFELPYNFKNAVSSIYNDKLFIIGGYNLDQSQYSHGISSIIELDLKTKQINNLETVLPHAIFDASSETIDNIVYIFGGKISKKEYLSTVTKINLDSFEVDKIQANNLNADTRSIRLDSENKVYIFGGDISNARHEFFHDRIGLAKDNILLYDDGSNKNLFRLFNSSQLDVKQNITQLFIGNKFGLAETLPAQVYDPVLKVWNPDLDLTDNILGSWDIDPMIMVPEKLSDSFNIHIKFKLTEAKTLPGIDYNPTFTNIIVSKNGIFYITDKNDEIEVVDETSNIIDTDLLGITLIDTFKDTNKELVNKWLNLNATKLIDNLIGTWKFNSKLDFKLVQNADNKFYFNVKNIKFHTLLETDKFKEFDNIYAVKNPEYGDKKAVNYEGKYSSKTSVYDIELNQWLGNIISSQYNSIQIDSNMSDIEIDPTNSSIKNKYDFIEWLKFNAIKMN